VKPLVSENDDRNLSFTMMVAEAGEAVSVIQTAVMANLPYLRLRDAVMARPTMAEGLAFPFANVAPRSEREVIPKHA
jgi:pyruvate/2-oxoglutarate dehydrogenase complex dihydrolipoamide dehydrogenase (E3) component